MPPTGTGPPSRFLIACSLESVGGIDLDGELFSAAPKLLAVLGLREPLRHSSDRRYWAALRPLWRGATLPSLARRA